MEGVIEDHVKKKVIFHWFVFFCRSLYIFLYGAMTPSISMFHLYTQDSSLRESGYENLDKTGWPLALTLTLTIILIFRHDTNCQFVCSSEAQVLFVYYYASITGKKWRNYTVYLRGYNDFFCE